MKHSRAMKTFGIPTAQGYANAGFTLTELMVAIAIIGLLASMVSIKMQVFTAKARQAEAKNMLNHLYGLENAYFADKDAYVALAVQGRNGALVVCTPNDLGFSIAPCNEKVAYGYRVRLTPTGFMATASSGTGANNRVIKNCAWPDTFMINEARVMTHLTPNIIRDCIN